MQTQQPYANLGYTYPPGVSVSTTVPNIYIPDTYQMGVSSTQQTFGQPGSALQSSESTNHFQQPYVQQSATRYEQQRNILQSQQQQAYASGLPHVTSSLQPLHGPSASATIRRSPQQGTQPQANRPQVLSYPPLQQQDWVDLGNDPQIAQTQAMQPLQMMPSFQSDPYTGSSTATLSPHEVVQDSPSSHPSMGGLTYGVSDVGIPVIPQYGMLNPQSQSILEMALDASVTGNHIGEYWQNDCVGGESANRSAQPGIPNINRSTNSLFTTVQHGDTKLLDCGDGSFMLVAADISNGKSPGVLPSQNLQPFPDFDPRATSYSSPLFDFNDSTMGSNLPIEPQPYDSSAMTYVQSDEANDVSPNEHNPLLVQESLTHEVVSNNTSPARQNSVGPDASSSFKPHARRTSKLRPCLDCDKCFRKSDYPDRCQRCGEKHARHNSPLGHFTLDQSVTSITDALAIVYPPLPPAKDADGQIDDVARAKAAPSTHLQTFVDAINREGGINRPHNHWGARHQRSFNENARMLEKSQYSNQMVTARLWMLFQCILDIYEGTSRSLYAAGGTNNGYNFEKLTLHERLEAVERVLMFNKRVAMDVIEGKGVMAFAQSPKRYHARKQTNNDCNEKKSKLFVEAKRQATEAGSSDALPAGPRRRNKRLSDGLCDGVAPVTVGSSGGGGIPKRQKLDDAVQQDTDGTGPVEAVEIGPGTVAETVGEGQVDLALFVQLLGGGGSSEQHLPQALEPGSAVHE